ncbi:MAG: IPT/TIG domain-containing protein [Sandaracinaceae bacterium]
MADRTPPLRSLGIARVASSWRTGLALGALLTLALSGLSACGGDAGGELQITNIDPRAGATAGEQAVQIRGNGFRPDLSYTVYFGNKRSLRSTILDEHTLLVATPQMDAPGTVDVIVAADNGAAFRITQGFRFENMGGNVMENVGSATSGQGEERF